MAKKTFTIAHDIRMNGKHVASGSKIELDATQQKDAVTLNGLLSSNRIVEIEAAHKHLKDCSDEAAKAEAPAVPVTPPAKVEAK